MEFYDGLILGSIGGIILGLMIGLLLLREHVDCDEKRNDRP
jgi:hypothetical protein